MKKLLVISALLCSTISFASSSAIKISNLSPASEGEIFPKISYKKNPKVADKINTFLQITSLETVPNSTKNPFVKVSNGTTSYGAYNYFHRWKRLPTPNNILALEIFGEGARADTIRHNFDLRNGDFIDIKNVINKQSLDLVVKEVNHNMLQEINDFINENKGQEDMYHNCLLNMLEQDIDWFDYYFTKKGIIFVRGSCSNRALRDLDELGDFNIPISYQKLKPYFTQYGNSLIFNSPKNMKTNNPNFKIYQGKIGSYPIHIFFQRVDNEDGSVSAYYWYDKHKKLIELDGKFTNNHFSLKNKISNEKLEKGIIKEIMELDLHGNQLTGFWQDAKSKKKLKIYLRE